MSTILTEYEGTKPGTAHKIVRGDDGVVYCSCWAWKMNKNCKHLERFFARKKAEIEGQMVKELQEIRSEAYRKAQASLEQEQQEQRRKPVVVKQGVHTGIINTADDFIKSVNPSFWDGGNNEMD